MAAWGQIIAQSIPVALGAAGTILGGINARKEQRKIENYLNKQEAENQSWYNENALGDYTQRADSQALLRNMRETLKSQNKQIANSAAITGATDDLQAKQKESSNKAIGELYSTLGGKGEEFKNNITNRYLSRKDAINNGRIGMVEGRIKRFDDLMSAGIDILGSSVMSLLGDGGALNGLSNKKK